MDSNHSILFSSRYMKLVGRQIFPQKFVWNINFTKLNGVRSVGSLPVFADFSVWVWQGTSLTS